MRKKTALLLFLFTAAGLCFLTVDANAQLAAVEDNYRMIRTLSCRMDSVVANSKGTIPTKSRLLLSGTNKRLDSISPDRMAFVFFNDNYSVYSYQDKKLITKKFRELSDAHLLFTEEMFWTILYNPFQILQERYILPPSAEHAAVKSPVTAKSRRDPEAHIVIFFNGTVVSSVEYYYKNHLNKRLVMDSPLEINKVKLPTHVSVSVYAGEKETMHIDLKITELEINTVIPDTKFTRIAQ